MGNWLYDKLILKRQLDPMIYGLEHSGKTGVLSRISQQPPQFFGISSIRFSVFYLHRYKFEVWDTGDNERYEMLYTRYLGNCRHLIYVLDSSRAEQLNQCKLDLEQLLNKKFLKDCAVLVIATRQDVANCASLSQVREALRLTELKQPWKLIGTTLNDRVNLIQGFDWLSQVVT